MHKIIGNIAIIGPVGMFEKKKLEKVPAKNVPTINIKIGSNA